MVKCVRNAFQRKLMKKADQRLLKDKQVAPQEHKKCADIAFPIINLKRPL